MRLLPRIVLMLVAALAVAGCGADGEPVQPTLNANVGVSSSGTYAAGGVGVSTGPLNLFVGF